MQAWLARRWFLLILVIGLTFAVLLPDRLAPLTTRLPVRLVVGLSLLLVALSMEGRRLVLAVTRPGAVLLGLVISFGILPAAAMWMGILLPGKDLPLGLLIIASVPCTLSSAVLWTRQAGGDEALALIIVFLTCVLGSVVTPLWLAAAGTTSVTLDTTAMMKSLASVLILPLVVGQGVRRFSGVPDFMLQHRQSLSVFARLLVASVLIAAAVEATLQAEQVSITLVMWTTTVCGGLHLLGIVLGKWGTRIFGVCREDRIAIAFAGSQKTLPVGLFLFVTYFKSACPLAVLPLLLYHAGQLVLDTIIADQWSATRTT